MISFFRGKDPWYKLDDDIEYDEDASRKRYFRLIKIIKKHIESFFLRYKQTR